MVENGAVGGLTPDKRKNVPSGYWEELFRFADNEESAQSEGLKYPNRRHGRRNGIPTQRIPVQRFLELKGI
jgi:hypothetical protein